MTVAATRTTGRSRRVASAARLRWRELDLLLLGAVVLLTVLGCVLVWSATVHRDDLTGGDPRAFLAKQVVNVGIGLGLMVLVAATDHRWVRILAPVAYGLAVVGLVLVLAMGTTINGSRSWLMVGGLSLQPSELAKLAVVVGMALVVAERSEGRWRDRVGTVDVVLMLAVAAVPAALILAQPDLGTMLVLSATVFGVVAASGAHRRWLAVLLGSGVAVAVVAVATGLLQQ